jgi:hypothetical protein
MPTTNEICVKCMKTTEPEGTHDEVIICDCGDCEYHMGCINLKKIPEGSWICPSCERCNQILPSYLNKHDIKVEELCKEEDESIRIISYKQWLRNLAEDYVLTEIWKPCMFDDIDINIDLPNEIDTSDIHLIGSSITIEYLTHIFHGRIIDVKYDDYLKRYLHLIQFKSGINLRIIPFNHWICLNEHNIIMYGELYYSLPKTTSKKSINVNMSKVPPSFSNVTNCVQSFLHSPHALVALHNNLLEATGNYIRNNSMDNIDSIKQLYSNASSTSYSSSSSSSSNNNSNSAKKQQLNAKETTIERKRIC